MYKDFHFIVDMIVLVGDLVDDTVEHLKSIVEPLGELSAPKGMYFVTGKIFAHFETNSYY